MRSSIRPAAHFVVALSVALALSGCTGDDPDPAPATSSAADSGAAGVGIDPEESKKWCASYAAIAANLGALGQTPEEAESGIKLLATFDRLWVSAGLLSLVTSEEVEANRAAVAGYREIMQLVADGADENEIRAADAEFTAGTEDLRDSLSSSSAKIIAACDLGAPSATSVP